MMENAQFSEIPKFRFHPEPFSSRALVDSKAKCECCGKARGYLYEGPVYSTAEVEGICPWCIADGSAASKWDAQFTDGHFRDSYGDHVDLPAELYDEVFRRTPGVVDALQPVHWWVHCEQPAAFLRIEDDLVRFRCVACGKNHSYRDLA